MITYLNSVSRLIEDFRSDIGWGSTHGEHGSQHSLSKTEISYFQDFYMAPTHFNLENNRKISAIWVQLRNSSMVTYSNKFLLKLMIL